MGDVVMVPADNCIPAVSSVHEEEGLEKSLL